MNQSIYEAIKLIESITASRFYTERGRMALIDTVAAALYLSAEDKEALIAAQQPQYTRLQDVRNARMLLVGTRYNEVAEVVLRVRQEVLTEQAKLPFVDKNGWLQYIRQAGSSTDEEVVFEAACFQCAIGRKEDAYRMFTKLATDGNLTALWMALGLAVQLEDEAAETVMLYALCELYDRGILDDLPSDMRMRLKHLQAKGYSTVGGFAFDFGRNKIGF